MKKTYIAPQTKEIKVNLENVVLAGSDFNGDIDNGDGHTGVSGDAKADDIEDILNWID